MQLNWGIAAAGRITHDFVTALGTLDPALHSVVAVSDAEVPRAQEFAQRHGIPKACSFIEMAEDKEVQCVYVGTLNPFHYHVAKLFVEHGKHVLCEKPMCLSYRQAEQLYKMAQKRGVFLMEGMWSRFFPSYGRLKELLQQDCIGQVTHIQVQHGFQASQVQRIFTRSLGGSITLDIGLYALQLGQLVYGAAPICVRAEAKLNDDDVDVETEFVLDYGEGRKLSARVSGLENLENYARIIGTKGELKLPSYWCCLAITKPNQTTETWSLPSAKFDFHHHNSCGLRFEAEAVRQSIEKHVLECPMYTQAESLELIALEEEILRQIGVHFEDVISLQV